MKKAVATLRWSFAIVVLLASLALVTWRQSRAFVVLGGVDAMHRQISIDEARRTDLERRIQTLESRSYVVPAARERLGMHTPDASELVILPESAAR